MRRLHIVKRVILRHRPSKPNMAMKNAMNNKSNNKVTHFTSGWTTAVIVSSKSSSSANVEWWHYGQIKSAFLIWHFTMVNVWTGRDTNSQSRLLHFSIVMNALDSTKVSHFNYWLNEMIWYRYCMSHFLSKESKLHKMSYLCLILLTVLWSANS